MPLLAYVAVLLVPLGLAGLLAATAWLENWLPTRDDHEAPTGWEI
jgi:hypothetical protein